MVVLYGVIELVGKLLKHVLGVLLLCWQRMFRFGLSVGVLSFIMVEVVGSALTRQFPPTIFTTVVAMIIAFALGYAAALTALADELFVSAVDTVRMLEGDAVAGLRAATAAGEREAGEARQGLLRWLGHPPANATTTAVAATGAAAAAALASRAGRPVSPEQAETLEAIAATDTFQSTAPRPRVNARPVRADQLPRIPWTYDQAEPGEPAAPAAGAEAADAAPAPDMPPLPLRVPDAAPLAAPDEALTKAAMSPVSGDAGGGDPSATLPAARRPTASAPAAAATATDAAPANTEADTFPAVTPPGEPAADLTRAASVTTPLAPDADASSSSSGDHSIWARIGQALVGNTMPLAALGGTHTVSSQSPHRPRADSSAEDAPAGDQTDQTSQSDTTDQ